MVAETGQSPVTTRSSSVFRRVRSRPFGVVQRVLAFPFAGETPALPLMPLFCDVALAVPLDMAFTYAIPAGMEPVVGGRVLVPFRQQRMSGIVVELHDREPQVKTPAVKIKKVIEALDLSPVLDGQLLKLGQWIADYYLAPIGEVFRTMLPLSAEFKRTITYRITDQGHMALHLAGMSGSPARSQRTPEDQLLEFRVLDYLAERESVREMSPRGATRASKPLLSGMVRKKWIVREDVSAARDAARMVRVAVLLSAERAPEDEVSEKATHLQTARMSAAPSQSKSPVVRVRVARLGRPRNRRRDAGATLTNSTTTSAR